MFTENSDSKIKLLKPIQLLLLVVMFILGLIITWFGSKQIMTTLYANQVKQFEQETNEYTMKLKQRLTRVEDSMLDTQSFFDASKNVGVEELGIFVKSSQITEKLQGVDSVFFIDKYNQGLNTSSEKITHDIEKGEGPIFLHKTPDLHNGDADFINEHSESLLSTYENGQLYGSIFKHSEKDDHIHLTLPLFDQSRNEILGYLGVLQSLGKCRTFLFCPDKLNFTIKVTSSEGKMIKVNSNAPDSKNDLLFSLFGVDNLNKSDVFSFAGLNWELSYLQNISASAPLWLQVLPYLLLVVGFSITLLVVSLLYLILTSKRRAEIKVNKKTEELREQKLKFQSIFNNTFQFTGIMKPDGTLVETNKPSLEFIGANKKEVVGKKMWKTEWFQGIPETKKKVKKAIKKAQAGDFARTDIQLKNKDGSITWVDYSIIPVYDDEGEVKYMVPEGRNIQRIKEYEEHLEKENAKDEAILRSIGEGLVVADHEGKIEFVNDTFEDLLGWKQEEVLDKHISEVMPMRDEDGGEVSFESQILSKVLDKEELIKSDKDYYFVRKNGDIFPVSITVSPIELNGEVVGTVEVFRDITKIKELDKAKDEFVSLASHQLRTPLSTISWYSEMLLDEDAGELTEEQREFVQEIYDGNQRMIDLVTALLNVSRIESGRLIVNRDDVNLSELVKDVVNEMKPRIEEKDLDFQEEYDEDTPVVQADPRVLMIILHNLVSNAVKYTPEKGQVGVKVYPNKEEEMVQLEVWDTGYGIPEEQKDQIFSKLFRADNIKEKDTTGTGLGLYVTKSILDKTGGKIWFESEEGEGTTFFVQIPFEGMQEQEGEKSLAFGKIGEEQQDKIHK